MILFLTLATCFVQTPGAVSLKHVYTKGMKSEYEVVSELNLENRERGLATFLPDTVRFKYSFFTNTLDVTHDIAMVRYSRPNISVTGGATPDSDPKTTIEKADWLLQLQISPLNELLDDKDLSPKKPKPKPKTDDNFAGASLASVRKQGDLIGPFLEDLQRLSAFIGGPESSLDFEPRFHLDAVKVGDTWQRTLSYQPQKLASKSGKTSTIVKRVDLTYTYKGIVESNGQKYQRVHADLTLNTDLGEFYNGFFGVSAEVTGLKSIPTTLTMKMEFDLDPKSMQTVHATVNSEGNFKIFVTQFAEPYVEQNIRGFTEMRLVSNKMISTATATSTKK